MNDVAKRKAISKKVRFEIFKRDSFTCQYCGAHPPKVTLHIDHIIPVAMNGTNESDNLITSCDSCNLGKGARSLSSVPASLKDRAKEVKEREEQIRGYSEIIAERRERLEGQAWDVAELFMRAHRDDGIRRDWLASIKRFLEELDVNDCLDAMDIAIARKPWSKTQCFKYFCGICWNRIRDL